MLLFKGNSRYRQLVRGKPCGEGIKLYMICESTTGYVLNARLDARDKTSIHDQVLSLFPNQTSRSQ